MTVGGVFLLPLLGGTIEAKPALEDLTSPGDLGVEGTGEGLEPSPIEAKSHGEEADQGAFLQALLAATAQVASAEVLQEVAPRLDDPAPPPPVAGTTRERAPLLLWSGPALPPMGEANGPPRVSGEGRSPEGVGIDLVGSRGSPQDVGRAMVPSAQEASSGPPQLTPPGLQEGGLFPAEAHEPTPEILLPVVSAVNMDPIPAGDQEQPSPPPADGSAASMGGREELEAGDVPSGEPPVPPQDREFEPSQPSSGELLDRMEQAKPRKSGKSQGIVLDEPAVHLMRNRILPNAQAQPSMPGGEQERPFESGTRETPGQASDPVQGAGPAPQGGERDEGRSVEPSPSPRPELLPEGDPPAIPPTRVSRQEILLPDPSPSIDERGSTLDPEVDGREDSIGELPQQPFLDKSPSHLNQAQGGQGGDRPALEAHVEIPSSRQVEGKEVLPSKRARKDSLDGSPAHHDGKVISREEAGQRPSVQAGNDLPEAPEKVDYAVLRNRGERAEVLLHLRPRHLGEVEMRVEGRHREVSAEILAERPPTVDLVRAAVPHLRQSLEEQGIHVQAFEVALASGRGEGQGGGAHHQPREQAVPWFEPFVPGAEEPIPSKASRRDGRIDLIV